MVLAVVERVAEQAQLASTVEARPARVQLELLLLLRVAHGRVARSKTEQASKGIGRANMIRRAEEPERAWMRATLVRA
jgi:hypothetical protein